MDRSIEIWTATATDSARIEAHLLRLSPRDRSLRFTAGLVTDETIRAYVAGLRFGSDAVLAIVDIDGVIVGLAHGCVYRAAGELRLEAAFSIDEGRRRQGLGSALMAEIDTFATRCGARAVVGFCVVRNLPMRRIFERAGMTMTRDDDDLHAFRATTASAPMPSCVSVAPARLAGGPPCEVGKDVGAWPTTPFPGLRPDRSARLEKICDARQARPACEPPHSLAGDVCRDQTSW